MVEFLVLVEYTGVMVLVVYCLYLSFMGHISNQIYCSQLKDIDKFRSDIANMILTFAILELWSFISDAELATSRHKAHRTGVPSIHHQLAFILDNQWQMMLPKLLLLWGVFAVSSSLKYLGADLCFHSFKWLRGGRQTKCQPFNVTILL